MITYWYLARFLLKKNYLYLIGYLNKNKVKPLTVILLETKGYITNDNAKTRWMSIEDQELLKEYNDIRNDISNSITKEFDSESIYNKKYLKTRSYGNQATVFHDK